MKTFKVPMRDEVSESSQAIFDNLNKALGFVPNLYATIALSENGLSKFLAYQNAKTSLSNREKEAVNLVVSEVNGCRYCLSAHTAIGKLNGLHKMKFTLSAPARARMKNLTHWLHWQKILPRTRAAFPLAISIISTPQVIMTETWWI